MRSFRDQHEGIFVQVSETINPQTKLKSDVDLPKDYKKAILSLFDTTSTNHLPQENSKWCGPTQHIEFSLYIAPPGCESTKRNLLMVSIKWTTTSELQNYLLLQFFENNSKTKSSHTNMESLSSLRNIISCVESEHLVPITNAELHEEGLRQIGETTTGFSSP